VTPLNIDFKITEEGVTLSRGNTTLHFKSSHEIDPAKVAEQLDVEPVEVLKVKLKIGREEATQPITLERLNEILGTTVKRDDANKLLVFLCMLSAYTEDSQFNISFRAPSSTGKSYIPLEVASYFPSEDLILLGYSSPTAFFHDQGEWDAEANVLVINLDRKILIFLDQPHDQLLQRLRPLLSHDRKELVVKITDKSEKRGLRTKTVILRGFPSVIFCTGSLKIDEQEQTRHIILSPEMSQEKLRESLYLKGMRRGNPKAFQDYLKQHPEREVLRRRVVEIKNAKIKSIIIRNYEGLVKRFEEKYPKIKPRHTRDIERLISIIQALALLNLWHRERDEEGNVYVNSEDVEIGFSLYDEIAEAQDLGIPPFLYQLYHEVIQPTFIEKNKQIFERMGSEKRCEYEFIGLRRDEILKQYFEIYNRPLPAWQLKQEILPALENAGLIYQERDQNDKRRTLVFCTTPPSHSTYLAKR
jgi:hypothetical protein